MLHKLFQLFKFGLVGIVATGVYIATWAGAIEIFGINPFWANFPAFGIAFIISFFCHVKWTFKEQRDGNTSQKSRTLSKFVCVSLIGLALNSLITYLLVDVAEKSYIYAGFLMATVVPIALFLLNKCWVFRPVNNETSERCSHYLSLWGPLIVISVAGLILRLYRLDYQSSWYDESFSILTSRQPIEALLQQLISDFVQPPLHYLLLHFVPFHDLNHSGTRLFSALSGAMSIPIMYLTGRVFFDKTTASIGAILLAVSQLAIMYSQEVRPYAQQMLFICCTLLFFGLAIRTYMQRYWWAFVISAVLAIYTHYYSIFLIAPLFCWALFCEKHLSFMRVLSGVVVLVLLYVPWLTSGIIEAAQSSAKVSGDQPGYFAISSGTVFHVLNAFNNGNFDSVLGYGSSLTYLLGMILFTTPALTAINRRWLGTGTTVVQATWLWTTLAVFVGAYTLIISSSNTLIAISLLLFLHSAQLWLKTTKIRWITLIPGRALWIFVLIISVIALYLVNAHPIIFAGFGLLLGQSFYGILISDKPQFPKINTGQTNSNKSVYLLTCVCFLPVAVPILMGVWGVQFDVRYTLAGLPAYYLLVAKGISLVNSRKWRGLFVSLVVFYSLFALRANYYSPYKENWWDSLALVAKDYRPEDCIVVSPFGKLPLEWRVYGYDQQQPKVNVIPLEKISSDVPLCDEVWLFYYSRVNTGKVKEKNNFAIQTISDSHKEVEHYRFFWIDVGLYKR